LDFFLLRHFEAILTPFLFAVAATVCTQEPGQVCSQLSFSVLSLNTSSCIPFFLAQLAMLISFI